MKILIAVIAYNEEKNIASVVDDLNSNNFGYDIVVIDNGSHDETISICRRMGIDYVTHCINSGNSMGTVATYFLYAYQEKYDMLCQFDGDGQHLASELPKIIEPLKKGEADYVIGSRFLLKEGFQSYFFRRVGVKLFSMLNSTITGTKITDATSGFRAYGKNVINFFAKYYKHEIIDPNQLLLLSYFMGAKIKEVPVQMRERLHGSSEFNLLNSISFPLKGFIKIMGSLLQSSQVREYGRIFKNGD